MTIKSYESVARLARPLSSEDEADSYGVGYYGGGGVGFSDGDFYFVHFGIALHDGLADLHGEAFEGVELAVFDDLLGQLGGVGVVDGVFYLIGLVSFAIDLHGEIDFESVADFALGVGDAVVGVDLEVIDDDGEHGSIVAQES